MKKIIAIVAVIATLTACLCVGANAANGITLQDGTEIEFKETLKYKMFNVNLNYRVDSQNYISIWTYPLNQEYENEYSGIRYKISNSSSTSAYNYTTGWENEEYKKITINGTQTISDIDFIEWLYENTESGLPPRPLQKTIDNTKATFSTTLTVATAIMAWLMANQIALVGLYMYILIALVATGKRFIKGV